MLRRANRSAAGGVSGRFRGGRPVRPVLRAVRRATRTNRHPHADTAKERPSPQLRTPPSPTRRNSPAPSHDKARTRQSSTRADKRKRKEFRNVSFSPRTFNTEALSYGMLKGAAICSLSARKKHSFDLSNITNKNGICAENGSFYFRNGIFSFI